MIHNKLNPGFPLTILPHPFMNLFSKSPANTDLRATFLRSLRKRSAMIAMPAAMLALGMLPAARAVILDWDGGATGGVTLGGAGTWDNVGASNWWDGTVDVQWNNINGDVARFGGTAGNVTIGAGGVNAYGLTFNSGGYVLSGAALTLDDPNATLLKPVIQVTNLADTATINAVLAGTVGFEKTGAGTLVLGGVNTISGAGLISAGTIKLTNVGGLGTTDTTVSPSTTLEAAVNGGTLTNGIILNGGTFRYSGVGQLSIGVGKALNLTASSTVQTDTAGTGGKIFLTAGQLVSSAGTVLTKTGNGMIQLGGANTGVLSTSTVVNGGLFEFQNADGLGTGTQNITLNSGTEFVSSGVGVRHNFSLNTGSTISANALGSADFTGALTLNGNTTAALRMFHQPGTPGALRLSGSLAGSGNLIVTGAATALQTAVAGPPTAVAPAAFVGQSGLYLTANTASYSGNFVLGNLGRLATVPTAGYDPLGSNTVNFQGGTLALSADLSGGALANSGFLGRYFNGAGSVIGGLDIGSLATVLTRNDATVDSINNAGGGYAPAVAGLNATNIGATWSGALNITTAGVYNFNSNSDDGSSIFVDGMPVAVNDVGQGQTQRGSAIALSAGLHSVVIKWGQGTGGAAMQASYSGPDTTNTNVRIGSVASSVTNSGSAIIGSNTIDNPIVVSPSLSGTIDLAAVNVTSTGALTMNPGGTLIVTGQTGLETFTHSGVVTLNGMALITAGTNGAALIGNSSRADVVLSGTVGEGAAGSSILKTGTGTLTLSGTNNFTGTAFSGQGVLALNAPLSGGVGATSIAGATTGTVKWLASNLVADTAKISLYGVAGLGGGLADLNGQSDTVGGVNVINNQGSSGVTLQTGAGTLALDGDVLVLGSSTGTNAFTGNLDLGGAARKVTVWGQNNTNISAVISNGDLVKEGRGQLTLSGANSAWTGLTTVNNGRLTISGVDGLGSTSVGTTVNAGGFVDIANITVAEPITINGKGQPYLSNTGVGAYGLLYTGALQGSGGFAANASGSITIGSAGTGIGAVPGSLLTVSGIIGDGGNNYGLSIAQGNAAALIGTGVVTGGPGIVKLTNANTFTGPLVVEGGDLWLANAGGAALATTNVTIGNGRADATLTMVNNNQLAAGTTLIFAGGSKNAKFQLNGTTQTVAGFNVSGSVAIIQNHEGAAPGAGTLIINNPTDTSFNGLIRDQNNVLAVTKTGVGTMTFSGNGIRGTDQVIYSGATTVNAGKLIISDSTNFNSPITLNTGGAVTAALEFNESFGRTTSYTKIITDNGLGFTKTGLGNLTLNNLNVVTGTVNVNAGTPNLTNTAGNVNPLPNTPINVAAGAQLQFFGVTAVNTTFNNNVTLNGMSHGGALAGSVVGGSPTNTLTGTLTLAATSNISTGWNDKTFNISGKITGAGGLVIDKLLFTQAPGIINIQNATNDYAGGTTLNSGTVQFTTGALPGGNLKFGGTFGNGGNFGVGQLVLSATAGSSFTRALGTGAGQVQFTGDGGGFSAIGAPATVNFGGAGATIDWQGTGSTGMDANASLVMNMGTGANNAISVANGINLNTGVRRIVTNTNTVDYTGVISGAAELIFDGGGTHKLSGATSNTATGLVNVTGGTLLLAKTGGAIAVAGDIQISNNLGGTRRIVALGGDEQIANTSSITFVGQSGNNGDLRLLGYDETVAGIFDRSGGGVIETVEAETATTGGAGQNAAGSVLTVNSSNDSFYNGFIRNRGSGTYAGTLGLTKDGTGTLTLSAGQQSVTTNQNYTGTTTILNGTLKLVNTEAFASPITVTGATSNIEFSPTINRTHNYGLLIGGTGNLVKSGTGTLVLSGATNSYSGLTTVNNGILQITNTQAAGQTGGYVVNSGGTLLVGNGSTAGVLSNNNAVTVNAGGTLAFSRNNAITHSGIISGAGTVQNRTGGGVITLSGANTYTGATQVNAGQIILAGNAASAGGLTVYNGGTLNLDFTLAGSSASGIVAATAPVSLNGGTLAITGSASANTQALGTLTFGTSLPGGLPGLIPSQPSSGVSNVNLTSGAGGLTVSLGAISHVTGATANFILPTLGTVTTSGTAIGGIANGFTTTSTGTTWLAQDGSGVLTPLTVFGTDSYGAGVNTDVVAGGAGGSTNSLRFNTAAATTVALTGANTIDSGGILVTSNVGANGSTISGGTLTGSATSGLNIIQNNTAGSLTISSIIADNGGATGLTKSGNGTAILSGANTYSGATVVNQGTLITLGTSGGGVATALPGGTLQIGNGTTNGTIPTFGTNAGTIIIANGTAQTFGTAFNAAPNFNFVSNAIGNSSTFQSGSFQKLGAGTLTLTNALATSSFHPRAGTTVIDTGGNVQVGSFSSIGLSSGDVGTLTVKGAGRYTVNGDFNAGDLSGSVGIVNVTDAGVATVGNFYLGKNGTGAGILNLSGFGTFSIPAGGDRKMGGNAAADTTAYGSIKITAGTFNGGTGNFQPGTYGKAVVTIEGGVSNFGSWITPGRYSTGTGVFNSAGRGVECYQRRHSVDRW